MSSSSSHYCNCSPRKNTNIALQDVASFLVEVNDNVSEVREEILDLKNTVATIAGSKGFSFLNYAHQKKSDSPKSLAENNNTEDKVRKQKAVSLGIQCDLIEENETSCGCFGCCAKKKSKAKKKKKKKKSLTRVDKNNQQVEEQRRAITHGKEAKPRQAGKTLYDNNNNNNTK